MLYDKRWDANVEQKAVPTVADFIAWLETQDLDQTYDYTSSNDCIYVRYLKARGASSYLHLGPAGIPRLFNKIVHPLYGAGFFREAWRTFNGMSHEHRRGWTYGDALRRAKKYA